MTANELNKSIDPSKKFDHIAIAVRDLEKSSAFYCNLLDLKEVHREYVKNEDLDVVFLEPTNSNSCSYKIELISPRPNNKSVTKFLTQRGEGIHHIAYLVENLNEAISDFKKSGAQIISGYPRKGSRGKTIAFFSPKTTNGVLIEICAIN